MTDIVIKEIFAWVSDGGPEGAGICGATIPGLGMTNLVTADRRIAEGMGRIADEIKQVAGVKVRLVRYEAVEVLGEL